MGLEAQEDPELKGQGGSLAWAPSPQILEPYVPVSSAPTPTSQTQAFVTWTCRPCTFTPPNFTLRY